jgi:hypothetical protein
MNSHHIRFLVAAAIVLLLLAPPIGAQEQERETFRALARHTGTGPSGQTSIQITIDRFSSEEEHDHMLEVIMNEDNEAIADELGDLDSVGFLRVTGRAAGGGTGSWQLRYARQVVEEDGTRTIRIATDRPILFVEAARQPRRSWDSQTTLIELNLDENGEGQGVLMAGVEFTIDAKTNQITLSHLSSSPVSLEQVRPS